MTKAETFEELGILGVNYGKQGEQAVTCPECSKDRKKANIKCLSVNVAEKAYKCNHCGFCGVLNSKLGENKPVIPFIPKTYTLPQQQQGSLNEKAKKWVSDNRGISESTVNHFGLKSMDLWFPEKGNFSAGTRGCIAFPYFKGETIVNHKYRDSLKCFRLDKDAELIPYNINCLYQQNIKEILIVEGEFDVLACYESGYKNTISPPAGANLHNNNLEWLDNHYDLFEPLTKIIIGVDNDSAGENLKMDLIRRFGVEKCFIVDWVDCKDANQALLKYDKDFVINCIHNAQPVPIEGIYGSEDLGVLADYIYTNGLPAGVKIGWNEFDEKCQWIRGEFIVVTGIPSHGKSVWVENVMIKLAQKHSWKFGVWVAESDPEIVVINIIQQLTGRSIYKNENRLHPDDFIIAKAFVLRHFYFFKIADTKNTLEGILDKGTELVRRYGINGLYIDPWSYVEKDRGKLNDTEFFESCLPKMKIFRQKNDCSLFVVAHPRKMDRDKRTNAVRLPEAYDISGSGQWYGAPDKIFTIWANFNESGVPETHDIHILKQKKWWLGNKGVIPMVLNKTNGTFNEERTPATEVQVDYKKQQGNDKESFTEHGESDAPF